MIQTRDFVDRLFAAGYRRFAGVPCSYLAPLIDELDSRHAYLPFPNEGDAVAFAAGQQMAGSPCGVLMQNSGLNNALSPLTSLTELFAIPMLLVIGNRGGDADEPQHRIMSGATRPFLQALDIPIFDAEGPMEAWLPLCGARSVAVLVNGKSAFSPVPAVARSDADGLARMDVLERVARCRGDAVVMSTTGFTSRELYALSDRPDNFYMVGSMGCLSSLALGVAMACPQRRVIALDGDGACMMRLGALVTLSQAAPGNLLYMVLDNGAYESTNGQPTTLGPSALLPLMEALAPTVAIEDLAAVEALVRGFMGGEGGYTQAHVRTRVGTAPDLPRPAHDLIFGQARRFEAALRP